MAALMAAGGWPDGRAGETATILYFYNPDCRQCDDATAEVKRMKDHYGERLDVRYKNLFDKHTGDATAREFHAIQRAFRIPNNVNPVLAVVIEPRKHFIGGSDNVLKHLERLLAAEFGAPAAAANERPDPAPAPGSADPAAAPARNPKLAEAVKTAGESKDVAPAADATAATPPADAAPTPPPVPDLKDFVEDVESARPADAKPDAGKEAGKEAGKDAEKDAWKDAAEAADDNADAKEAAGTADVPTAAVAAVAAVAAEDAAEAEEAEDTPAVVILEDATLADGE